MSEYFGTYRGKVEDNVDPDKRGRVKVSVPAVTGSGTQNWALPSSPIAGPGIGLVAIPAVGANVWVQYEGGDAGRPIWTGCFWNSGDAPLPADAESSPDRVVALKTTTTTLTLSDLDGDAGGVTIQMSNGMKIAMTPQAIEVSDGQGATIKLEGPTVTVNDTALEVT